MTQKTGPYIGVTGFMSRSEILEAIAMVPMESTRRLMVGVLMSSKTLAGQTNKWPGRYPKKEVIRDIFVNDNRALNLIHYNTDNPYNLYNELREIVELAGPNLDGFQLNVKWPNLNEIYSFDEEFPQLYLLLQIGSDALKEIKSVQQLRKVVIPYLPCIRAILIDPSGGKGEPLDANKGAEYLRALEGFQLDLGIAGGLGPNTLNLLDPLIAEFPNLSIDAEGRLRTPKPEDALDLAATRKYLKTAYTLFKK